MKGNGGKWYRLSVRVVVDSSSRTRSPLRHTGSHACEY